MSTPENITLAELETVLTDKTFNIYLRTNGQSHGPARGPAAFPDSLADDIFARVAKLRKPPEPENWPPQVGDIWEAAGNEYYVREHGLAEDEAVVCAFGADVDPDLYFGDDLDDFKVLKPKLVRRRGRAWSALEYIAERYGNAYVGVDLPSDCDE